MPIGAVGQSRIGHVGRKAEAKTAKRQKGKLTRASGAMAHGKGDIVLDEFLVENKSTVNASLSIPHDWLAKISREALEQKKKPALTIQFTDGLGNPLKFGAWVLIPENVFETVKALYAERMS
jgi:hypothetical protein